MRPRPRSRRRSPPAAPRSQIRADVTDELDVERLFDETIAAFGRVDLVIHAAACDHSVLERRVAP